MSSSWRFCIAVHGAVYYRGRQCRDLPCLTLIVSSYGSVVIGVYGGVCFILGNKCSFCPGMSINKITALIAID